MAQPVDRVDEPEPDQEQPADRLHPLARPPQHLEPNSSASTPSRTDTVTCPKPQSAVIRAVRPRDQPCAARQRGERHPVIRARSCAASPP
jgi:hypothetical protein